MTPRRSDRFGIIHRAGRMPPLSAFSLLELILVIALMGVLSGVTVPILRNSVDSHRMSMAASTMAEAVRYTRSTCISKSLRGRLVIETDPPNVHLELEEDPLNAPGTFTEARLPFRMQGILGREVRSIAIQEKTPTGFEEAQNISFFPDGRCTDAFLYLRGNNARCYTIAVVGISGQVMVFDRETTSYYESEQLGL